MKIVEISRGEGTFNRVRCQMPTQLYLCKEQEDGAEGPSTTIIYVDECGLVRSGTWYDSVDSRGFLIELD